MLAWAQPQRFLTLTNAPEDWQKLRQKLRHLTVKLRADGYPTQMAWTVERGSKTGMRHVHALQHGAYVPQRLLQDRWGAITHIEAIKGSRAAAGYAMKEAMRVSGYAVKGAVTDHLRHLELNGGRGCHYTRGYLHGRRLRDVEKMLNPSQEGLTWVLVANGTYDDEVRAAFARTNAGNHSSPSG